MKGKINRGNLWEGYEVNIHLKVGGYFRTVIKFEENYSSVKLWGVWSRKLSIWGTALRLVLGVSTPWNYLANPQGHQRPYFDLEKEKKKSITPWRTLRVEWGGLIDQHTKPSITRIQFILKPHTPGMTNKVTDLLWTTYGWTQVAEARRAETATESTVSVKASSKILLK